MKEIMAIIRPNKLSETKKKLVEVGCYGFTCIKAQGRGKKMVDFLLTDGNKIRTTLISKRVLNIIVPDEYVNNVIKAIIDVNSTGNPGDGKIFVCSVEKSYKVRTRKEDTE